jgi:cytochrome d ubiquinol oxidase subunit I
VANSWQQTPAGFHLVERDGALRAEITDFWALVFNPSSTIRFAHVIVGALILGAFFAMSIAAWYALKGRHATFVRRTFAASLVVGLLASLAAPITGHYHAAVIAEHQPTKLAAFEGHFRTGDGGAPMYLFGFPDEEEQRVKAGIAVPGLLSFLIHADFDATVPGLDRFPRQDWPPVALPFYSFHIMVALGVLFILLTLLGAWYYRRGTLLSRRWLLWILVFAVAGPYAANQLGWIAAEVGRQPWVVWGLQRTSEGLSPAVRGGDVLASILLFSVIYLALFAIWIFVLNSKIQHGPDEPEGDVAPTIEPEPELQIAG